MTPNWITVHGGFTLIELLVVVLIIGILAAVALPQYQKAVVKSRLANAKTILAAIKTAEELYYLENGTYTGLNEPLNVLDIEYACTYAEGNALQCDDYFMIDPISGNPGTEAFSIRAAYCPNSTKWNSDCNRKYDFMYTVWLNHSAKPGQVSCSGRTELGKAICKSEGF